MVACQGALRRASPQPARGALEKTVLQLAAVIGEDVPLALLEAVSVLPADELHGAPRGSRHEPSKLDPLTTRPA